MISLCKQLRKQSPQILFSPPTYKQVPQNKYQFSRFFDISAPDMFSSGNKSHSLSSTRSKGLSLSVKKISYSRQIEERKTQIKNPQQMTLLQNSGKHEKNNDHSKSVHNLRGRNMPFLSNNKNLSKSKNSLGIKSSKQQRLNIQNKNIKLTKTTSVLEKQQYQMLINKKLQDCQSPYNIRVIQPQRRNNNKNSLTFQQQTIKPSSLAKRSFLRSKNNPLNHQININTYKKTQEQISFCCNSRLKQQKAKKQFLQSYIQKPMINSIIMTTPSDQLKKLQQGERDPQSPVMKLKQRLQVNRINNIFQKETIISKEGLQSCSSIRIQESMIIQKRIRQNFIVISNKLNVFQQGFQHPYKMYLVKEKYLNMLISIKECPLQHISSISQQILIYKQLTSTKQQFQNILSLYQFSLDFDRYLLIKQAYSESLCQYLQGCINQMRRDFDMQYEAKIKSILKVIQSTLYDLSFLGIRLRRLIELDDIVLVFQSIKIQNLSIFKIGNRDEIQIKKAISNLQQQIMIHLNKISKGSVATSHQ